MTAETTAANSIEMLHSDALPDGQRIAESHISTDMELEDTEISQARYLLTLLAMLACVFVAGLDFTAVAAIMPSVGLQYSKLSTVNWLITANMLGLAVMLPLVSKLGNIFGYQAIFGAYGLVFIAGSVMAGASTGMKLLLAGRAFAGMGASAAIAIPLMVVTEAGSKRQRALGLRVLLAAWLLASVLGLVIGGYLCKHENWNWVFYLSCLGYIVALLLSIMLVRLPKYGSGPLLQQVKRIDILGLLFLAGSILTLILALNLGGNIFNWSSGVVIVLFVLAAFLAVLFFLVESKVAVDPIMPIQFSFPREEEKILEFWREIDAFQTSLKLSEGRKPFTFYDGPPFCTGLPHHGHLLAGTIKDIITRYAHNTGHYVERRAGWDTHGLPIENMIDKKLNIKGREDVLAMGIDKYNAECRAIVMSCASDWHLTVERLGRWIDFDNDYKTLDASFMESVWWVFKQLHTKGHVYRGLKVMPFSTGLQTTLSNHEAQQNYMDVSDPTVIVAFPLRNDPTVSLIAFTTTPWTLPSNCALCVNPDFEYIKIKDGETGNFYILLESCLGSLYKNLKTAKFEIVEKIKAADLIGLEYEPLFDFYKSELKEAAWRVISDSYVTSTTGTGIVHNAPAYGVDDYRVCLKHKIFAPGGFVPTPVKDNGIFDETVGPFSGMYVKDADKDIAKSIKARGRLVRQGTEVHSYPFCYRSNTPLLYRAVHSWFVRVEDVTEKLLANNSQTHWVPDFVKEKRFGNWLEGSRDWCVSRSRFWGTPIPLWVSEDYEEVVCVGSVAELEELTGATGITDLHRDSIDHLTIPSRQGKGVLRRVDEVLDCWFESGSMPYAQKHYPFENKELFEQNFPADFISEGIDQTRGWFYTLLVLSTLLFDKPAWKNLIASGLVLAEDGKKMSKSLQNYPDPNLILDTYGADSLRLYLINSPVVRAETLRFKQEGVKDVISRVLLPWYNAFRFFETQVQVLKKDAGAEFMFDSSRKSNNTMDRWMLASVQSLTKFVREEMAAYRLYTVVPRLLAMIDQLTNWYVRFNRRRLKGENGTEDAVDALNTLYEVLLTMCRLMAPFTPFLTENMYQSLKVYLPENFFEGDSRSVHFVPFPEVREEYFDTVIERAMSRMQTVIELGRITRERVNISLKTPLLELVVVHPSAEYLDDVRTLSNYITEELNVRSLVLTSDEDVYGIKYRAEADFKKLGTKLRKDMPRVKNALPSIPSVDIKAAQTTGSLLVDGITLETEDFNIVRFFDALSLKDESKKYEEANDREVIVLMDVEIHNELMQEGVARDIVNRVQRLRKKAGLSPVDDVVYHYQIGEDPNGVLASLFQTQAEFLLRSLKQNILPMSVRTVEPLAEEEHDINESKLTLILMR
ncbi:isoleucine--tRNA ligase [Coemansia sp. S680]|nr:isoleucine--tRNA ligase [Coemansia sp. S680]